MELRPLFKHQQAAYEYGMRQQNPALFMDMRLGKSIVTIRICKDRGLERVLVVAPKTALIGWYDELQNEGVRRVGFLPSRNKAEQRREKHMRWFLTSFEYFMRHPELEHMGFDALVIDESTRLKNPTAKITKMACKHWRHCVRFALSGMPAPEDVLEYVPQFLFLNGSLFGESSFWKFREKHCIPPVGFGSYNWNLGKRASRRLKAYIADNAFICTRQAAGLEKVKLYEKRIISQTENQKRAMASLFKSFEYKGHSTKWRVATATWAAQISGGLWKGVLYNRNKFRELLSLLEGELQEEVVVVFFRFSAEIKYVQSLLRKSSISFRTIDGATGDSEKDAISRGYRFGKRPKQRVVLCQIKCVKYALDLAAASTAIYYSNSFSLEERVQSEQRILHLKKDDPLLYVDLIVEGTMDEEIHAALSEKRLNAKNFLKQALENIRRKLC